MGTFVACIVFFVAIVLMAGVLELFQYISGELND